MMNNPLIKSSMGEDKKKETPFYQNKWFIFAVGACLIYLSFRRYSMRQSGFGEPALLADQTYIEVPAGDLGNFQYTYNPRLQQRRWVAN